VPNTTTQMVIEDLAKTQEITPDGLPFTDDAIAAKERNDAAVIAKEKEVIELISIEESDSEGCDDMDILTQLGCENCENCGKNIAVCNCFEDSFIDDESYLDTDDYSEEESDDLFDI